MMMTAVGCKHEELLRSPKLAEAMTSLTVKRPQLSPLKRKRNPEEDTVLDEEDEEKQQQEEQASPTSSDELVTGIEKSVISPKKKVKADVCTVGTALVLDDAAVEDGSDEACQKVLAAYVPVDFDADPAEPLTDEEMDIFNFFLS